MADLLTDDGRPWAVDDQRLEEIALLTDVMVEASARSGPLIRSRLMRCSYPPQLSPGPSHPIGAPYRNPDVKMHLRAEPHAIRAHEQAPAVAPPKSGRWGLST